MSFVIGLKIGPTLTDVNKRPSKGCISVSHSGDPNWFEYIIYFHMQQCQVNVKH